MAALEHVLPRGIALARVCVRCGTTKGLRQREYVELLREGGAAIRTYRADRMFGFWRCEPCERGELNAQALSTFGWIGAGVVMLGAATVGFNDHPVIGVLIALIAIAVGVGTWLHATQRTLRVTDEDIDGTLTVRNVHALCIRATADGVFPNDDDEEDEEEEEEEDD